MSQKVIEIKNLYKEYKLGLVGRGTLYRDLQSWWARVQNKEDPNSIIGANDYHKSKKNILAIDDLNLDITQGEIYGLIGANGAGKSTLLKVLSRITSPTKGEIKLKGKIASLLEVGTGFHPELTGRENIFLNGAINGMNKNEIKKKLEEIIDFAGIEKFIDTPVKRYSSGMTVRLGFAVAAFLSHSILAIDEILAVGDLEFRKKAVDKVEHLSGSEGRTVIFVSHNMQSIQQLCSKVGVINNGKLIKEGKAPEMIVEYNKLLSNFKLDNDKTFHDRKFRRGNGKVRFKNIVFLNEQKVESHVFDIGQKIFIKFDYQIFETLNNLSIKVAFKSPKTSEILFSVIHVINSEKVRPGGIMTGKIEIDTKNFLGNSFETLFWLGTSEIKGQGDVIDGLLPPIVIKDKESLYDWGYFKTNSKISF